MATTDTKHTRPPDAADDDEPSCPRAADVESGDRLTYFQPSPLPSLPPPTTASATAAGAPTTVPHGVAAPMPGHVYGHRPLPVPGSHPETPSDIHWPKAKPTTRAATTLRTTTTTTRVSPVYVPAPLLRGVFYDEESYGRDAAEHSTTQETSATEHCQAIAWTPKFAHYTELPEYAPPSLPPKQQQPSPSDMPGEDALPEGYPVGMRRNTLVVPRPWRHLAWILRHRPRVSCVDALGILVSCLLVLLTFGRYRRRLWYAERGYWIYPRAGRVAFSFVVPAAMIDAADKGSRTSRIPLCPGLLETAIHYRAEDAGRFVERFAPTFERKISSRTLCRRRRRRRLRQPLRGADDSDEGRAPADAEPYSCEEEWLEDALGSPLPRLTLYALSDSVKHKQD